MLRLAHMYKPYGGGNDACRTGLALANEVAQFHECRRRIAKGEQGIGMLLDGQTYAGLGARDVHRLGHFRHTWVAQIALGLDAETRQRSFAHTAGYHSHIAHNGVQLPAGHLSI